MNKWHVQHANKSPPPPPPPIVDQLYDNVPTLKRRLRLPSAKTSVLAHAVFQGFTCRNFFNMPEFKFGQKRISFIQNGMFEVKNEKTACSILNSMLKIRHVEIGIRHVENR